MLANVSFQNTISLLTSWARFSFPENGLLSIHKSIEAALVVSHISCDPEAVWSKVYHSVLLRYPFTKISLRSLFRRELFPLDTDTISSTPIAKCVIHPANLLPGKQTQQLWEIFVRTTEAMSHWSHLAFVRSELHKCKDAFQGNVQADHIH